MIKQLMQNLNVYLPAGTDYNEYQLGVTRKLSKAMDEGLPHVTLEGKRVPVDSVAFRNSGVSMGEVVSHEQYEWFVEQFRINKLLRAEMQQRCDS